MKKLAFDDQLDELYKNDVDQLINQHITKFNRLILSTDGSYVLFGAGRLGKTALAGLRKAGIEPVAFADNNPNLWDKSIDGLRVLSPKEAALKFGRKSLFVATVYTNQPVLVQLRELGLNVISFATLAWQYPKDLLPHADLELPDKIFDQADDIRKVMSLCADDTSRREYLAQLHWRTTLHENVLPAHLPQQDIYFPDDIIAPVLDDVFVDCGAFDGDTIREFIKRWKSSFGHIIAIEPDPTNWYTLRNYLLTLDEYLQSKITIMQFVIGSNRARVSFNATGTMASSIGNGTLDVESDPLDELMDGFEPTYIKMDIEGAEPDAIIGARKIIEKHPPVLAVCAYHKQEHLWKIPLLIQSLSDEYKLFLRRYSDECWELVCYAIPAWRVLSKDVKSIV